MAVKYRLPCACGKSVEVDSSQAGLSVACACGQQMEVPTHRGLMQLERVELAPSKVLKSGGGDHGSSNWGPRKGLRFLGITVEVIYAVFMAFLFTRPSPDPIGPVLEQAEPAIALQFWEPLRTGIDTTETEVGKDLTKYLVNRQMWLITANSVGGAALLLLILTFVVPDRSRNKTKLAR